MEIMLFRDGLTNRGREGPRRSEQPPDARVPGQQPQLPPRRPPRRMRQFPCPEHFMTRLHRAFEVLRVVISASNDQEIFHATGDKDFPILDKPEIAGSEEWPSPVSSSLAPNVCAVSSGLFQ